MKIDYKPWRFFHETEAFPYARLQRTSIKQKVIDTYSLMIGCYTEKNDIRLGFFDYISCGLQFYLQALINAVDDMQGGIVRRGMFSCLFNYLLFMFNLNLYLIQALLFLERVLCGLFLTTLLTPAIVSIHYLARMSASKMLLDHTIESDAPLESCPLYFLRSELHYDDIQFLNWDEDIIAYIANHDTFINHFRRLMIDQTSLPLETSEAMMLNRAPIRVSVISSFCNSSFVVDLNPTNVKHLYFLKSCIYLNIGGIAAQLENEKRLAGTLKTLENLIEMMFEWSALVEAQRPIIPEDVMGVVFEMMQQKI